MKKLMIGCAIALSAVAANAVSFNWSAEALKYDSKIVGGETTMYFYNLGGDTAASGGAAETALMALYDAWDQKSGSSLSEFLYNTYKEDYSEWTSKAFSGGAALITESADNCASGRRAQVKCQIVFHDENVGLRLFLFFRYLPLFHKVKAQDGRFPP